MSGGRVVHASRAKTSAEQRVGTDPRPLCANGFRRRWLALVAVPYVEKRELVTCARCLAAIAKRDERDERDDGYDSPEESRANAAASKATR